MLLSRRELLSELEFRACRVVSLLSDPLWATEIHLLEKGQSSKPHKRDCATYP